MGVDLDELLGPTKGRHGVLSAAARKEQAVRSNRAQAMASTALRRLHREDYQSLYQQALVKVYNERGPLPD